MNRLTKFIYSGLLISSFIDAAAFQVEAGTIISHNKAASSPYYTLQDFNRVKKFDTHIHLNTYQDAFIKQAQHDNFCFLDIVDDRPFGLPMAEQQKIAIYDLHRFPRTMVFATTFGVKNWDDKNWAANTIASLKNSFLNGARAVKIWKNIGLSLKDKNGKFVMVNNPRLDTVLNYLEQNHIPVIGHNGEPKDCWLPLDKMTFGKDYYGEHPEYHMYLHPDHPSYNDEINARDSMLMKHPHLNFVGAHLGTLEWSLDELAKRLDKFPNMSVDLSRMPYIQLHALRNRQKTRNFFIKYQNRLLYGTDMAIDKTLKPNELQKTTHDTWISEWKFYATGEKINLPGFGVLRGLKLPKKVIDKIYRENAEKWLSINN
jgi:predicted TIM-barrel fold metal-dependent hydrolase